LSFLNNCYCVCCCNNVILVWHRILVLTVE